MNTRIKEGMDSHAEQVWDTDKKQLLKDLIEEIM
jgi:hypothetical protein